jgi:hypothetical protein
MTLRVTWRQALAWRMERQLVEPIGDQPGVEVVRRLAGVQAQVASSAQLAVRLRQHDAPPTELAEALSDGRLVKTWAMRGTLHLLPADEAGRYLSLIAAGRSWESPAWLRYFGMTAAQMEDLRNVVREILDGRALTRAEVTAEIVRRPGYEESRAHLESGWGTLFKPLAWQGDIVFGPTDRSRPTFALPEQVSPHWRPPPPPDEAAPLVISAYLAAYGPATPNHVRSWLARGRVSVKQLRQWFAAAEPALARVEVDGDEMFVRSEDVDELAAAKATSTLRLLGGFDQWVLGPGTDDEHVLSSKRRSAVSRTAGWIAPVVIVGGVVSGTWALDGERVPVDWFAESGAVPTVPLASEVDRLSAIVGRPLTADVRVVS